MLNGTELLSLGLRSLGVMCRGWVEGGLSGGSGGGVGWMRVGLGSWVGSRGTSDLKSP